MNVHKDNSPKAKNELGIHIFECSFYGVRGGMSKPDYLQILKKNGGMTDECT